MFVCAIANATEIPLIPSDQVIVRDYFVRHTPAEIEVIVLRNRIYDGLITLSVNGRAIAKFAQGQAIRLYLRPGSYRFGVVPSYSWGGAHYNESRVEITPQPQRQLYVVYQSSGFTSSGGSAVYEVSRVENGRLTKGP